MAITRNTNEGNTIETSFGKYCSKVLVRALLFSSTLGRFEFLLLNPNTCSLHRAELHENRPTARGNKKRTSPRDQGN